MSCSNNTPAIQHHLSTTSTSGAYSWFTGWIPVIGLDRAKLVLKQKAVTGNLQTVASYQTAIVRTDDPDSPSDTATSCSGGTTEACSAVLDLSSATAGKAYIRFGVGYKLSSGSMGEGDVSLQVSYESCGQMVGGETLTLQNTTDTKLTWPISDWLPALSAEKAKAMVIATSITGTLRWMITYRTATTSIESPGSWNTDLEAGYHSTGEVNTGQLTLTVGSAMWVQLGVQYWSATNGTLAASTLGIAIGVRKA